MMNWFRSQVIAFTLATLAMCSQVAAAPLQQIDVFARGEDGYFAYRIPAIVQATDGTLLGFAEGRKNSVGDFGDIDLVLKRSFDGGLTWGPLQVIYDHGTGEAGNPAPVVDINTGNIVVPISLDRETPAVVISTDHGQTWSSPVDITSQVKLPNWGGGAPGPVHGIQLQRGPHAGRLVIPAKHTLQGQNLNLAGRESHIIYSDDGGQNWSIGGILRNPGPEASPHEATVVELVDGRVYMNTRNQIVGSGARLIGYSEDSGETFQEWAQIEPQLIDPRVQGALVRYSAVDQGDAQNRILFSNPAHLTDRVRMTIRSSFDETETWNAGKLVHRGRSGYSDLVKLAGGGGGLLYESGTNLNYQRITFARFDSDWLDDPTVMQIDFRDGTANDQRGNGIHGTFVGSPSQVAGDANYGTGQAMRFDGAHDMVRIGDTVDHLFDFDETDSFTLEAVFRTSEHKSGGATGSGPLISKDVIGLQQPAYWLRVQNDQLRFFINDGSQNLVLSSPAGVADGEWHHAAAVLDRDANELRLYLNHELVDTQPNATLGSLANANDLLIGAMNVSSPSDRRFNGDIDTVRISLRALDSTEFLGAVDLPGDFNADGFVDGADFLAWQRGESPDSLSLSNFSTWQSSFGTSTPPATTITVPEPTSSMVAAIFLWCSLSVSRRQT